MEKLRGYKLTGFFRGVRRTIFKTFLVQKISDGGWHFTWMAGVDKIIKKLESFAHQEFNKPEYKDPKKIRELINSGKDVLFPQNIYEIQELNDKLPTYLVKNRHKFEEFLLNPRD